MKHSYTTEVFGASSFFLANLIGVSLFFFYRAKNLKLNPLAKKSRLQL
jgi:hypothetical protein